MIGKRKCVEDLFIYLALMNKINLMMALIVVLCLGACNANLPKTTETNLTGKENGKWTEASPEELPNAIQLINKGKMVLAAGNDKDMNAMAISQGSIGYLWHRPVVTIYISSNRHTHKYLENNDYFTLSTFAPSEMNKLMYLGTHSGRDGDKIKESSVHTEFTELGNPSFQEATMTVECKKIYSEPFKEEKMDSTAMEMYKDGTGTHAMYIGEIVNVWIRK